MSIVEVGEEGAKAGLLEGMPLHTHACGNIGEKATGFVVIDGEDLTGEAWHPEVLELVVIDIAPRNAHGCLGRATGVAGDAGEEGVFEEGLALDIAEKKIGHLVIGNEEIDPAVVVEVRCAGSHAFADGRGDIGFL